MVDTLITDVAEIRETYLPKLQDQSGNFKY